jgi:hypothetical protein
MFTIVLLSLGAFLSLVTIALRGDRLSRWVPTGLVLVLVAGAALATALGSRLDGHWHAAVVIVGLLAAAVGGNHITTGVFEVVDESPAGGDIATQSGSSSPGSAPDTRSLSAAGLVLRGGAWIGVLERLAVFATLAARWPEGIAVVLAIKALGRYPELRTAHRSGLAERFIIGTLVSLLWAALCVYAATGPALQ